MNTKHNFKMQVNKLFAIVMLGFASCTADWMIPEPLSFYAPEKVFVDADAMLAALTACERTMRSEYTGDQNPNMTDNIFSDVAVNGVTDKAPPAQNMNLQITPTSELNSGDYNRIGWFWINGYSAIKNANAVITRIDDITFRDEAERNAVLSAAYFYRAYWYYRLTHQFGDVPYVGGEVQTPKVDFYSTKREVILQSIKKDMDFAAQWCWVNPNRGRVSRGACGHLLTKINLSLGLFDDAITSATAVIEGGQHSLMTQRFGQDANLSDKNVIYDLHHYSNKSILTNREVLLSVISRENVDNTNNPRLENMRCYSPAWSHPSITTPSGIPGNAPDLLPGSPYNYFWIYGRGQGQWRGEIYATKTIWQLDDTDLRHQRSWYDENGTFHQGNWMELEDLLYNNPLILTASVPPGEPEDYHSKWYLKPYRLYSDDGRLLCLDTIRNWYGWPHYKNWNPDITVTTITWNGGRNDWYVFRLAETYLLRAEAFVWKNELQKAADDINVVRRRAKAREIDANEVNISMILDERARELYLEEPRKTELTRIAYIYAQTGKTADNGETYRLENFSDKNFWYDRIMATTHFYNKGVRTAFGNYYTMSSYHVLWPIPQASINSNTLGVINQNKGYSGYEKNVPPLTEIE